MRCGILRRLRLLGRGHEATEAVPGVRARGLLCLIYIDFKDPSY